MLPNSKTLDNQCPVSITRWIDIGSEEWKEMDDNPAFTKKILRMGLHEEPAFLFTDNLGRIWGKGENGTYYPFHLERGKKLYGLRIAVLASN